MSSVTTKQSVQVPVSVLKGVTNAVQRECRRQFTAFVEKIKSDLTKDGLSEEEITTKANQIVDELCSQMTVVEPTKIPKEKKAKVELNSPEEATDQSQLKSMKVSELVSYLKGAKLNPKGKKSVLVERVWNAIHAPDNLTEEDKKISTGSRGRPSSKKKTAEIVEEEELVAEEVECDFMNVYVKTDNEEGVKMVVDKMEEGVKKFYCQKEGDEVFEKVNENGTDEYWLVGMFVEKDGEKHVDFDAEMDDGEEEQ